jgi:nucleotide-binding universal stress UspA family protein
MQTIRKILAAVDFSEHSDHALDTAIALAKTFGAELDVIHAFDLPIPLMTPYEVAVPDSYLNEARRIQGKSHLREVPAAPAIAEAAEEIEADLIVMGTRGHTGLKHIVLGSVAERTLRIAPCSVLTVKGDE